MLFNEDFKKIQTLQMDRCDLNYVVLSEENKSYIEFNFYFVRLLGDLEKPKMKKKFKSYSDTE